MAFRDYWSNFVQAPLLVDGAESMESKRLRTAAEVFFAYAPRVYRLARSILSNDTDAEEVTQEVLLQVVRKLDSIPGDADLTTWLHRITVNAALCLCRKHRRRHECPAIAPLEVRLNGEKYTCTCRLAAPDENAELNSGKKSLQCLRHGDRIILDIADETQG